MRPKRPTLQDKWLQKTIIINLLIIKWTVLPEVHIQQRKKSNKWIHTLSQMGSLAPPLGCVWELCCHSHAFEILTLPAALNSQKARLPGKQHFHTTRFTIRNQFPSTRFIEIVSWLFSFLIVADQWFDKRLGPPGSRRNEQAAQWRALSRDWAWAGGNQPF